MYYSNKIDTLKSLFRNADVSLEKGCLIVGDAFYPIVEDVIILLDASQYPAGLDKRLNAVGTGAGNMAFDYAEEIQFTFGNEWQTFPEVMPEHKEEFNQYFDLIDLAKLEGLRVCDLGCGIGRWSYFLESLCRELILVDFSEAIFVARRNLAHTDKALFFMGDLMRLPFRDNFCDFIFCLGVLHHLPVPALEVVRMLKNYAPWLLIYLYYALDNRPFYFRILLGMATALRLRLSKCRSPSSRELFTWVATLGVYLPFIALGRVSEAIGLNTPIPLYETYKGKGVSRIRQDVYDRFFTGIEQRYSKAEIMGLEDSFDKVLISESLPYWHFVCKRASNGH